MEHSEKLGTEKIGKLIIQQSVPAAVGFMVMSIYTIVDTIFVGHWVGKLGIAAVTVVTPITFLFSSIGMAIGIGGASVISRALGAGDKEKAGYTFGNQIIVTMVLSVVFCVAGFFFEDSILTFFGAKGEILEPAKAYFEIVLIGIPMLAWAMMSNNVIRAQGKPKVAMMVMLVPAISNMILDPILMIGFDMGIQGAAWSTTVSYYLSAAFGVRFFMGKQNEIRFQRKYHVIKWKLIGEVFSIGSISLVRQGTYSLITVVFNNILFDLLSESGVSVYGIVNRMMMFALFPVIGVMQGFMPIVGYNFGAQHKERVLETIKTSIKYGTIMSFLVFLIIQGLAKPITMMFTDDPLLIKEGTFALRIVFSATPIIAVQMIGAAYYQAIGKARPALILTLFRQGMFLIPFAYLFSYIWQIEGVWAAFPASDVIATTLTVLVLYNGVKSSQKLNA